MTDARTRALAERMPSEAYKPAKREFNFEEANAIMDADEIVRLEAKAAASPGRWVRTETMAMMWRTEE